MASARAAKSELEPGLSLQNSAVTAWTTRLVAAMLFHQ